MIDNGGLDFLDSNGGGMNWLNSRNLREKTWQGFEMGGSAGEESVRLSPKLVHLRYSLR